MRELARIGRYVFLGLLLVTAVISLFVAGYSHRMVGDSGTTGGDDTQAGLPAAAGPVLTFHDGHLHTEGLPPKTVALTFDDGPDPTWTPAVLAVLARQHVPATFFLIGSHALDHPDLVSDEVRAGDAVGLHTYTHLDLTTHPAWQGRLELSLTQKALAATGGVTTTLLRPPYSSTPDGTSQQDVTAWAAVSGGYRVVLADRDSEDWQRPGVPQIVQNATPTGTAGTIIMMHDGGGDRAETVAALTQLITNLKSTGWRFVTVPTALGLPGNGLTHADAALRVQGWALLIAERGASWMSTAMGALLVIVAVLSLARAALMVGYARRHARRGRPAPRRALVRRGSRSRHAARPDTATGRGNPVRCGPPPAVSVVVPAYNEEAGIAGTVTSLAASRYPVEIIVVDDGSTDRTADTVISLLERIPQLRLLRQTNAGKAHALNHGIRAASGDIIVLIDGDTVVTPDTIGRIVRPFADPGVGGVAGNTKIGNRGGLLGRWQHIEYVVGFNLDRRFFDLTNSMQTIPGAIGAFRRTVLEQVGGVPVDTLAEDTDLTIAVGLAGWRVAYEGSAHAWTEAPASLTALWRQRHRWAYGTMQAAWKHRRALGAPGVTGPGGATTRLGRLGLPYLLTFGILLPLLAPLVDLFALVGLLFTSPMHTALAWLTFGAMQFGLAGYALHLDGERTRTLWALPLQQIVYRQVMYLVVVESLIAALTGRRLRWHKLDRHGTAGQALTHASQTTTTPTRQHALLGTH